MSAPIPFALIGAGWRSEFYLRIAERLPWLQVCGVVSRDARRRDKITRTYQVPTFADPESMLKGSQPAFVVCCVTDQAMFDNLAILVEQGQKVLAETPPATTLEGLTKLCQLAREHKNPVQVAEQYIHQPLHAARLEALERGWIGEVTQAQISVCHGYHAISLIRHYLGVGFANAKVRAHSFTSKVIAGPDRKGSPTRETLIEVDTDHAWLDFGDRFGVYEFSQSQYRNPLRGRSVCLRGTRGEIRDLDIVCQGHDDEAYRNNIQRIGTGVQGNLEGYYLKGYQARDSWLYQNPFIPIRFSDEETAVARCLQLMVAFCERGEAFYSLAQACQDQYLALMMKQAAESGQVETTQSQCWATESQGASELA